MYLETSNADLDYDFEGVNFEVNPKANEVIKIIDLDDIRINSNKEKERMFRAMSDNSSLFLRSFDERYDLYRVYNLIPIKVKGREVPVDDEQLYFDNLSSSSSKLPLVDDDLSGLKIFVSDPTVASIINSKYLSSIDFNDLWDISVPIFVFNKESMSFEYLFRSVDQVENVEIFDDKKRASFLSTIYHDKRYLMLKPIWGYSSLYLLSKDKLELLEEAIFSKPI